MMPKTAINFYNMQKGLYLGNKSEAKNFAAALSANASESYVIGSEELAIAKSMKMLNAYGELNPNPVSQLDTPS